MKRLIGLIFLTAAPAFAQPAPAPASAPAPAPSVMAAPAAYRDGRGAVLLSSCAADGRFVVSAQTPAYRLWGDAPEKWFRTTIKSRVTGWSSGMSPEPVIETAKDGVLSTTISFKGRDGDWRAWFYGMARGESAQWAVVLAPIAIPETDPRVTDARKGVADAYAKGTLLLPETLAPRSRPPVRVQTAANEIVGTLMSSPLKWLLNTGPRSGGREYLLMKDGYVFETAVGKNDYVATGKWAKEEKGYSILWGSGSVETVADACYRASSTTPLVARPGCKLVQRTITTSVMQSVCNGQGENCTLRAVPKQTAVTQEQCG